MIKGWQKSGKGRVVREREADKSQGRKERKIENKKRKAAECLAKRDVLVFGWLPWAVRRKREAKTKGKKLVAVEGKR